FCATTTVRQDYLKVFKFWMLQISWRLCAGYLKNCVTTIMLSANANCSALSTSKKNAACDQPAVRLKIKLGSCALIFMRATKSNANAKGWWILPNYYSALTSF